MTNVVLEVQMTTYVVAPVALPAGQSVDTIVDQDEHKGTLLLTFKDGTKALYNEALNKHYDQHFWASGMHDETAFYNKIGFADDMTFEQPATSVM